MTHSPRNNSTLRRAAQLVLAVAALAAAGRIAQLACVGTPGATAGLPSSASATQIQPPISFSPAEPCSPTTPPAENHALRQASGRATQSQSADAELAEFYQACPLAAVIDLETVAHHPEQVDAILPPYRETADRVPHAPPAAAAPLEPAVPRIRYPVSVRGAHNAAAPGSAGGSEPRIATNTRATSEPSSNSSQQGKGTGGGDWLIDPQDWFAPDAKPSAGGHSGAAAQSAGGASGAEAAPGLNTPSASEGTPTEPASERPATEGPATGTLFAPPAVTEQLPAPSFGNEEPPSDGLRALTLPAHPSGSSPIFPAPAKPGDIDPHLALFTKNAYPSARECAVCHEEIYEQWSMSAHAYAAVSPMFNKFEQKLNDLSQGTVGYFCMRCHAPVATALCATRDTPLWQLPEAAREGITCVACHRVQFAYGKSNGERHINPGDIFAPVFGGIGGDGVAEAIARKDELKVKTSPDDKGPGQDMHITGVYFQPLTRSEFCTPCHQVAVYPGIKLEVVWEQYRASPACKKGIQCQDCHMGRVPGLPLGYDCGPVAKVNGKTVNNNRKKSNHVFYGPNYPVAHPGVFPFNLKAKRWTMDEWLTFDWRAGWGTRAFEDRVADGQIACQFPPVWAEADDRMDARETIDANLKKMELKREIRVEVMENGSHVEGPFFDSALRRGEDVKFHYIVTNKNDGHNLLTASLGAQPQLWANIVLIGPNGQRLWETGYTDSAGDVANIHSYDVRHKTLPFDWQLFNLQTMFLITGAKGTDREFYVPVNLDIDQLPFIRPGVQPITTINHPPFIRMESQSLAPLGSRRVPYRIPGELVRQPGTYRLSFRMRSRAEPIYFMRFCGATEEMERSMNEWMIDIHPMSVQFEVR